MKKFVSLMLGGALCAALLVGSVSCGGGEDPLPEEPSQPESADRKAAAYDDPHATLTLGGEISENGDISADLFGVFLEDINFASQALDDNMVVNGSFQPDGGTALGGKTFPATYGWSAEGGARLSAVQDGSPLDGLYDYDGKNEVSSHASVGATSGGAIVNAGYVPVPMAVKEGEDYLFSAFMKADSPITVTAEIAGGGKVYASTSFSLSDGWKKYERTLRPDGTADEGLTLRLTFSGEATVELDGVSLETQDSTVGIKNYLYNAVKELSPRFVRFPGGCVTEGENIAQTYDWKSSIGAVQSGPNAGDDVLPAFTYTLNTADGERQVTTYGEAVTRAPDVNLWQNNGSEYELMDYGIGFYEYFLLCESLGAKALPVVSCGLSCQGQAFPGAALAGRHGKGVEDYIRDAADLIEFAKGGQDTKWGKIRAQMGHAEPFEMDYLGVGNEQWDAGVGADYFGDYYEKFLENAYFMGKCEQYGVQLIVGNHQQLIHCEGSIDFKTGETRTSGVAKDAAAAYMEKGKISSLGAYGVQDHHYYNSPVDFLLHAHMYDGYAREGADRYEVFVGEYSANNNFKESGNFDALYQVNNWFSALSEAAAMTGFERNGDIVKLAAYAPMFAPVEPGFRHWPVDMMLFTNTELVRTANYYVQQLFMQNAGTKKIASALAYKNGFADKIVLSGVRAEQDVDRLYFVTSLDGETGDIILKIVNAGEDYVHINVDLGENKVKAIADITCLEGEADAVNSLTESPISPKKWTIGGFTGSVAGLNLPAYSVTAVRFHAE